MEDAEKRLFLAELRLARPGALDRLRRELEASGGSVEGAARAIGCSAWALHTAAARQPAAAAVIRRHGLGRKGAAAAARAKKRERR